MEFRVAGQVVRLTGPTQAQVLGQMDRSLRAGRGFAVATLNLDHLVKLRDDSRFRDAYAAHDIVTADGNPIVWLARAAGERVELVPGSDLMLPALRVAAAADAPVGFVGSTQASLDAATTALTRDVPGLDVRTCIAPPMGFDPDGAEAEAILRELAAAGVRLVLVAMGAPKQERFAALGRRLCPEMGFLCIGAGLDFVSGAQQRAPLWVRRMALEWVWRAASDPKRLARRYALSATILPAHAWQALRARLGAVAAPKAGNVVTLPRAAAAGRPAETESSTRAAA